MGDTLRSLVGLTILLFDFVLFPLTIIRFIVSAWNTTSEACHICGTKGEIISYGSEPSYKYYEPMMTTKGPTMVGVGPDGPRIIGERREPLPLCNICFQYTCDRHIRYGICDYCADYIPGF